MSLSIKTIESVRFEFKKIINELNLFIWNVGLEQINKFSDYKHQPILFNNL